MTTRHITLITTGGTIEKTYDERTGELSNRQTVVHRMLGELRLDGTKVTVQELMHKDSLDLTEDDRQRIVDAVRSTGVDRDDSRDGVVVLHGTDTLADTGHLLDHSFADLRAPVILTGALRPFEMRHSDALQNLTEALFATGVVEPGVYCVAHGRCLRFPGVRKDRTTGTFVRDASGSGIESKAG